MRGRLSLCGQRIDRYPWRTPPGWIGSPGRVQRHQRGPGGAELGDGRRVGAGPIAWD
jgi:hypothetical protein